MCTSKILVKEEILSYFESFPQFQEDLEFLLSTGFIKRITSDRYKWMKSETIFAVYIYKFFIGNKCPKTQNKFLGPIEEIFNVNRRNLCKLNSRYASLNHNNMGKEKIPRGFDEFKEMLEKHREDVKQREAERTKLQDNFQAVANLLAGREKADIEELRTIKEKIKKILI